MHSTPRHRTLWKILGILIAGFALAIGGLFPWIQSVESRQWAQMEKTLRALGDEAAARSGERPVLRGEAVPGNAWEDYDRAFKSMREVGSIQAFSDFLYPSPRSRINREQILDLLKKQAPALEAMRCGVRRSIGSRKVDWEIPSGRSTWSIQYFAPLVVVQARLWAEEGRFVDAAQLLVDGARFAEDAGRNADLIGGLVSIGSQSLVLDELKRVVLAGPMSADEFREVARELDVLDRSFPNSGHCLVNGAMCMGWDLHRADSIRGYLKPFEVIYPQGLPRVSAWRFAFSERMMLKDAFEKELDWSRRITRADAASWDEASRIAREVDAEREVSANAIPRIVGQWLFRDGYSSLCASFRERRAQIRLLRVAALFRASGEALDSEDPFGGKLTHTVKEGRLKVWSVGRNAVDDGGSGDWNPRTGKDIVLEVTR